MCLAIPSYRPYVARLKTQEIFVIWSLRAFFNSIDPYLPFDIGLILSSPASLPDCPGRYRRDLAKETLRPKAWISAHALLMLSSASLTGGALGMTNFFAELNRCHIYSGGTAAAVAVTKLQ